MKIDTPYIKEIARLSALKLTEEAISTLEKELKQLGVLLDELHTINTDNVAPLCHPSDLCAPLRSDTTEPGFSKATLLTLASSTNTPPAAEAPYYWVPQVMDTEES